MRAGEDERTGGRALAGVSGEIANENTNVAEAGEALEDENELNNEEVEEKGTDELVRV